MMRLGPEVELGEAEGVRKCIVFAVQPGAAWYNGPSPNHDGSVLDEDRHPCSEESWNRDSEPQPPVQSRGQLLVSRREVGKHRIAPASGKGQKAQAAKATGVKREIAKDKRSSVLPQPKAAGQGPSDATGASGSQETHRHASSKRKRKDGTRPDLRECALWRFFDRLHDDDPRNFMLEDEAWMENYRQIIQPIAAAQPDRYRITPQGEIMNWAIEMDRQGKRGLTIMANGRQIGPGTCWYPGHEPDATDTTHGRLVGNVTDDGDGLQIRPWDKYNLEG